MYRGSQEIPEAVAAESNNGDQISQEPPAEEEEEIDEEEQQLNEEYSQISRNLDIEMREFVTEFNNLQGKQDKKAELMIRKIRIKHPIFHLLTISAFKYLFENGVLLKVKNA